MTPSTETIKNLLLNSRFGGSGQIISDCPFCNKKGHFYINKITFLFDCKKCNETGNLYKLLQHLGQLHLLEGNVIHYDEQIKLLGKPIEEVSLDLDIPDFKLPVGFKKLEWNLKNPYAEYLKSRKYTKGDFEFYQPGTTSLVERYDGYVIIPVTRDYQIKGFIARYVGEDENKSRYENSKRTKFSKILDGYDQLSNNTHSVIIVEGHFDKVSVNYELELETTEEWKCVSTFGKKISVHQLVLLKKTNVQDLYFLYDFKDAINDIKKFGLKAGKQFNVYGCYLNIDKDPGDMDRNEILQALNSAQLINAYIYSVVQGNKLK